ncbi:MAG: aldo/keto reductase [Thermoplasmata archaeon]|uniref:Aldo/keto reductase n=1 Tax=Candidatus Sysuiplasma superficiale TaxID=2823368 RepID=A0A8J7YTB2_9ARCH|nr:aldo/keto reductase [Candidatus Sysuiplasma superficiale]
MKTAPFGNSGIVTSRIVYGTWYLPHEDRQDERGLYPVDRKKAVAIIDRAFESGIRCFDTADVYRGVYYRASDKPGFENIGQSERILGEALKKRDREEYVIVTKVTGRTGPLENDAGHGRKHIRSAVSRSLERLQTDYIDFYLLHAPDPGTSLENAARSMNLLIEDGSILHYGVSNFRPDEVEEMFSVCRESGLEPPSVMQDVYNLINREFESSKLRIVEKHGMAAMIYSPLAQGVLAGRHSTGGGIPRSRYEKLFSEKVQSLASSPEIERVKRIGERRSVPMSQVALAWLLRKSERIFPIVGATEESQIAECSMSTEVELSDDEMKELEGK